MPSQVLNSNMTSPEYVQMSADKVSFNFPGKRTWRITIEGCLFRAYIYVYVDIYMCIGICVCVYVFIGYISIGKNPLSKK